MNKNKWPLGAKVSNVSNSDPQNMKLCDVSYNVMGQIRHGMMGVLSDNGIIHNSPLGFEKAKLHLSHFNYKWMIPKNIGKNPNILPNIKLNTFKIVALMCAL